MTWQTTREQKTFSISSRQPPILCLYRSRMNHDTCHQSRQKTRHRSLQSHMMYFRRSFEEDLPSPPSPSYVSAQSSFIPCPIRPPGAPGSPENPIIIEDSDSDEEFPYRRCTYCKGDHLHPYCPVLVTFPEHPSLRFDPDFLPLNPVAST